MQPPSQSTAAAVHGNQDSASTDKASSTTSGTLTHIDWDSEAHSANNSQEASSGSCAVDTTDGEGVSSGSRAGRCKPYVMLAVKLKTGKVGPCHSCLIGFYIHLQQQCWTPS